MTGDLILKLKEELQKLDRIASKHGSEPLDKAPRTEVSQLCNWFFLKTPSRGKLVPSLESPTI